MGDEGRAESCSQEWLPKVRISTKNKWEYSCDGDTTWIPTKIKAAQSSFFSRVDTPSESGYAILTLADGVTKIKVPWAITGVGTEANPFLIYTPEQLVYMANQINASDSVYQYGHYKLMNNLDLSTVCSKELGSWPIIGRYNSGEFPNLPHAFRGVFDGNLKTVSKLYINNNDFAASLFGATTGNAVVKGLTVSGEVHGQFAGGITTGIFDESSIIGCTSQCKIIVTKAAGGISTDCFSTCIGCLFSGTINSTYASGIISHYEGSTLKGCINCSTQLDGTQAGRLICGWKSGEIASCYSLPVGTLPLIETNQTIPATVATVADIAAMKAKVPELNAAIKGCGYKYVAGVPAATQIPHIEKE